MIISHPESSVYQTLTSTGDTYEPDYSLNPPRDEPMPEPTPEPVRAQPEPAPVVEKQHLTSRQLRKRAQRTHPSEL